MFPVETYLQGVQAERADCRGADLVEVRMLKPGFRGLLATHPSLQEVTVSESTAVR